MNTVKSGYAFASVHVEMLTSISMMPQVSSRITIYRQTIWTLQSGTLLIEPDSANAKSNYKILIVCVCVCVLFFPQIQLFSYFLIPF